MSKFLAGRIRILFGCILFLFCYRFLVFYAQMRMEYQRNAERVIERQKIENQIFLNELKEFEERGFTYKTNELLVINIFSSESKIDPKPNLEFFIKHGLHDAADFLFVDNGGEVDVKLPNKPNIFSWKRENSCFDIGTHSQAIEWMKTNHNRHYKRFILMNMSVRGPFMPSYSTECWSDFFAGEDTFQGNLGMTGTTFHCAQYFPPHIQAMIVGVSQESIDIWKDSGLLFCAKDMFDAIRKQEIHLTKALLDAGKEIKVTMAAAWTRPDYFQTCDHMDLNYPGVYFNGTLQTSDIMFIKTGRDLNNATIDAYSDFSSEYSSYNYCKRPKLVKAYKTDGF